jgi:hypothetical protein
MLSISKGFIYRFGDSMKDLGERMGLIPVIRLLSNPVIMLGLAIRNHAMRYSIEELEK